MLLDFHKIVNKCFKDLSKTLIIKGSETNKFLSDKKKFIQLMN